MRSPPWLLVLAAAGAIAACGGESAFFERKPDASLGDGAASDAADAPQADTAGGDDGGVDTAPPDTQPSDGGGEPTADAGVVDGGMDAGPTDAHDGPTDSGVVLPDFVRVWTFDPSPGTTDGWSSSFGLGGSTIMYDGTTGSPDPGSLVLNVPFSMSNGGEQFAMQVMTSGDLTGRHVYARIRLESGGPAQGRVGYASTGNYVLVMAPPISLTTGQWTVVTLDVDNPPAGSFVDMSHPDGDGGVIPPTPTDTRVIAVNVSTPFAAGTYTPAVIHVDTVGWY
jgi:hypothetical protein